MRETLGRERMKDPSILDRVVRWARRRDDIRTAILVGSHAENRETDDFSDYDVCLFVTDQDAFAANHSWLDDIGEVWLCQKNTGTGEAGVSPVYYRSAIFAPGTRVDFSVYSITMLDQIVTNSPPPEPNLYTLGYRVLLDKDGRTDGMAKSLLTPLAYEKPTEAAFREAIEDFWHEAHNVAKYLARGDLWSAKFRDWQTKQYLLPMLEWHAHGEHGWEHDTGHLGKRMRNWVDSEAWQSLHHTFAHFDAEDSWRALIATIELYRRVVRETARMLGYEYLEREDKHMGDLIGRMRRIAQQSHSGDAQTRA